jgi:AcrR family transcriptional regulator
MAKRLKKTERLSPSDRKEALIAATLKCLSTEGFEGLSIRKISAEAGVAVGLINHHYANKEDLVAQAYEHLTLSHLEMIKRTVAAADASPRSQLSAFVEAMLSPTILDPGVLRAWIVFWGMKQPGNAMSEVYERTYGEYRLFLEDILRRLAVSRGVPLLDFRLAAIGLLALLDGLWIEGSLDPETLSSEDAVRLAEAWVDALVLGNARSVRPEMERPLENMA